MTPFVYPATPHVRRHGPQGYANYARYLPWLRDEFTFRCVYCLRREQWGRAAELEIDHFLAVANWPELEASYDNLLLVCPTCNSVKGSRILPDPCQVLTSDAVNVDAGGTIQGRTHEARRLIRMLALDARPAREFRLLWTSIVTLARRFEPELFNRIMGYPENLPDLRRLKPPRGNRRPEGAADCCQARRERGDLPKMY